MNNFFIFFLMFILFYLNYLFIANFYETSPPTLLQRRGGREGKYHLFYYYFYFGCIGANYIYAWRTVDGERYGLAVGNGMGHKYANLCEYLYRSAYG